MSISQDRFSFPEKYAMRLINKGAFLAAFTIIDNELGIEFRDVRLLNGKNGIFIGAPYREYEDKEKKTQRVDYWRPAYDFANETRDPRGVEYVDAMCAAAYALYEELSAQETKPAAPSRPTGRTSPGRSAPSRPAAPARSGRGPVVGARTAPAAEKQSNPNVKLPF